MSPWVIALAAGVAVALVQYGAHALRSPSAAIAALLRVLAVAIIVAMLFGAPIARAKRVTAWGALDVSSSMVRGDSTVWRAARDSLRAARPESTLVFGDSARLVGAPNANAAQDNATLLRPAVERALGAGHPLVVVTDGELDDPDALRQLPGGSRVVVVPHAARRDLAVATLDVPRAAVSGDTVEAQVGVAAGSAGAHAGTLTLVFDGKAVGSAPVDSLPPFGERTMGVRVRLDGKAGASILSAIVATADDGEHHNDTLSAAIDLSRGASAVFVSTSPDFDARYALAVLRGALSIPTRGFFRVAPGQWRVDGALSAVSEADVRGALHDAPVAIIHGDTAVFGPPRAATLGPLALIVTSGAEGEWYPSDAPASPLAPDLAGVAWDSLPPVGISPNMPSASWVGLEARRGRGAEKKPIVVGSDAPRRVAIVGAAGLWRWRFRGGPSSDAFTALWGGIFDWLAAERADRRAAVPDERLLRAGDAVRWRRGSPADSVVPVVLQRRGTTRVDSLTLRFGVDATIVESAPLPAGVYDVTTRGGTSVLVVNPSREWLPRAPRVASGGAGGAALADAAPRLRDAGWAYALAILLLCAEWLVRRGRAMR